MKNLNQPVREFFLAGIATVPVATPGVSPGATRITILVDDGKVTDVLGLPPGTEVGVNDYDVRGVDPDLLVQDRWGILVYKTQFRIASHENPNPR